MSTHHWDYIPAKDSELVPWSANFTSQTETNATSRRGTPIALTSIVGYSAGSDLIGAGTSGFSLFHVRL